MLRCGSPAAQADAAARSEAATSPQQDEQQHPTQQRAQHEPQRRWKPSALKLPSIGGDPRTQEESGPRAAKRQRRTVGFSTVQIYSHDAQLAGDRVPSTPAPPVGLGRLQGIEMRRIESFDAARDEERRGVNFIDEDARRSAVVPLSRNESIDEVEAAAELTRCQREASIHDPVSPLSSPHTAPPDAALFSLLGPQLHEEPSLSELFG